MDECILLSQHEVFSDMRFADLPAGRTLIRTSTRELLSRALAASGAQIADAKECRVRGEMNDLETPVTGSSYEVWELPGRRIATAHPHERHVAAREG